MAADKTWLFIPAKERFVKNIGKQNADNLILDLEDSLTENQKDEGLRLAAEVLQEYGKQKNIFVRINSGERQQQEIDVLCAHEFSGIMFPKFEDVCVLEPYQERLRGKEVIALAESIKGIFNLEKTASHPMITGLAFGGEDFCKDVSFEAGEEATFFARNQLVMYAALYRKYSLDGVCLEVRDMEVFQKAYTKTKKMGFTGKLLIHPNQVQAVQEYAKKTDVEYLKYVVKVFKDSGEGVLFIDGEFYEKPVIDRIEGYLKKNCGR